jgi:RimJ/RimL family protein N-acetyltransferase
VSGDIPTRGVLCTGEVVELAWPEEHELDAITELRNRPAVRSKFLDPRPLDPLANRAWLQSGMQRPAEAVLAIRLRASGALCGMFGWTGWASESRTPELGRVVVDRYCARAFRALRPAGHRGIAVDAALALSDYLFAQADARAVRSTYIVHNRLAARVNWLVGGRIVQSTTMRRADGTLADVVKLELTRTEWLQSRFLHTA